MARNAQLSLARCTKVLKTSYLGFSLAKDDDNIDIVEKTEHHWQCSRRFSKLYQWCRSSVSDIMKIPHFDGEVFLSIPSREILNGIAVTDENGNKLGNSTVSCQAKSSSHRHFFSVSLLLISSVCFCLCGRKRRLRAFLRLLSPESPWPHQEWVSKHHPAFFKQSFSNTNFVSLRSPLFSLWSVILPIIMQRLEKYKFMQRITYLHGPIQVMLVGVL